MLWTVIVLLLILWLLGFTLNVAGGLIHVLLVIALVVIVLRLLLPGDESRILADAADCRRGVCLRAREARRRRRIHLMGDGRLPGPGGSGPLRTVLRGA